VEKKGVGDLLEAMARVRATVPAARLVVVGDGPLRSGLEEQARRLGLDAQFAGWQTPEQIAERLRQVRVLCVPSRRAANGDAEGLPTVIPEAAAHGVPAVGTRHSGIPEGIEEDRSGLLADEGDVEGIAGRLIAVLTDDDLWRRLSAGAREHVARDFDPQRQAEELERIYDEVLAT
jgi:glycosyltransferase involved in cell wall biosynthesis